MNAPAQPRPTPCPECSLCLRSDGELRRHVELDHRPAADGAQLTARALAQPRPAPPAAPRRAHLVIAAGVAAVLLGLGVPVGTVAWTLLLVSLLMASYALRAWAFAEAGRQPGRCTHSPGTVPDHQRHRR